jgi:hypothetical protein
VIDEVPESPGAVQLTVDCPVPPLAVTPLGAPGRAVQLRRTLPGQPAQPPATLLVEVDPEPPTPVVAPETPWAVDSGQAFELVVAPAVNVGFVPLTKLVR